MKHSLLPAAQAIVAAYELGDGTRMVELAWVRRGSWELDAICMELEYLARQAWGDNWEGPLWDLDLSTTRHVERAIEAAQRRAQV